MAIDSLGQIQLKLRNIVPDNAVFSSINTRLIVQTGINLKKPHPSQLNADSVEKVINALLAMGFDLENERVQ